MIGDREMAELDMDSMMRVMTFTGMFRSDWKRALIVSASEDRVKSKESCPSLRKP